MFFLPHQTFSGATLRRSFALIIFKHLRIKNKMAIHYMSTTTLEMLNFSITGDVLPIDVTYKSAIKKSDCKLFITETSMKL